MTGDYLLGWRKVAERLDVGRGTLAQMVKAGEFPPPIRRPRGKQVWKASTVDRYIATLAEQGLRRLA